jgi:hypothetical protein
MLVCMLLIMYANDAEVGCRYRCGGAVSEWSENALFVYPACQARELCLISNSYKIEMKDKRL